MITQEDLKAACRAHDNAVDAGASLAEVMAKRGIDVADAVYVAQQRALRVILSMRGEPVPFDFRAIHLTGAEMEVFNAAVSMWLDGLAVGVKCTEQERG